MTIHLSFFPSYTQVMAPSLADSCPADHITSPDQAPGLQQQHQVSLLQVLSAVGAEQPCGMAQRSQDASMQQVVGHVCIHSSQGVIKEIELLFLESSGGTMDTKSLVLWPEPRPLLGHDFERVREDSSEEEKEVRPEGDFPPVKQGQCPRASAQPCWVPEPQDT